MNLIIRASTGLALGLALGALAQTPAPAPAQTTDAVRESVDPARAAAVERAADLLSARPAQPAVGPVHDKTAAGQALLSGGNSIEGRASMHLERDNYSLWVVTVAKPSGAYLADAKLRVVSVKDKTMVLERKMEGPWLFVSLPEGQYDVSATFLADGADKEQTINTRVSVPKTGQRQAVLRFDSKATVSPDMHSATDGAAFVPPPATK